MSLRALLVDDESHARDNLLILLEEYCPSIAVIGQASDVNTAMASIAELDPDVVFLDIRMPSGAEGFELLSRIESPRFMVVFVTAFKDYAIDAFKVNAVDYILKPIDIDELIRTVQRLESRFEAFMSDASGAQEYQETLGQLSSDMLRKSKRIAISHLHGVKLVRIEEISYLQAESNCTRLVFKNGSQYMDTRTLKVYEQLLEGHGFFRSHRSYLVNLDELEEFSRVDGNLLILRGGHQLPVARSIVQELLHVLGRL